MISARWVKDVVPEDVAEAQRYWELVRLAERMRAHGLSYEAINERCGILPADYYKQALCETSPLEVYLGAGPIDPADMRRVRALRLERLNHEYKEQIDAAVLEMLQRNALLFWKESPEQKE